MGGKAASGAISGLDKPAAKRLKRRASFVVGGCVAESDEQAGRLILAWREGDQKARDRLVALMMPELRQIAAARLRGEANSSLSTGDLINDAILRFMGYGDIALVDRSHFVALASRIMRNILIDHARAKSASKRHHQRVELNTQIDGGQRVDLESLDFALIRLGSIDPGLMELIEMRYFGGMSIEEVALATAQSSATVKRRWRTARAWLTDAMAEPITSG